MKNRVSQRPPSANTVVMIYGDRYLVMGDRLYIPWHELVYVFVATAACKVSVGECTVGELPTALRYRETLKKP